MGDLLTSPKPTQYEYFQSGGITNGLSVDQPYLTLNGKNFTLYSTALDYNYANRLEWDLLLKQIRSSGLNAVQSCLPWHLYQPQNRSHIGSFNAFKEFAALVQRNDLFMTVRIGPNTDNGYDFGGMPSWLLHNNDGIKIRSTDPRFMKPVALFLRTLLNTLLALQFTRGGPIIGLQVEHRYRELEAPDPAYLTQLVQLVRNAGIQEFLYTTDSVITAGSRAVIPDLFPITVVENDLRKQMEALRQLQPNKPLIIGKYFTSYDEIWGDPARVQSDRDYQNDMEQILKQSVSFILATFKTLTFTTTEASGIMPFNGTKSDYQVETTVFSFDSILTDDYRYTSKYHITRDLILNYDKTPIRRPEPPDTVLPTKAYPTLEIIQYIPLCKVLDLYPIRVDLYEPIPMEMIQYPDGTSQSFGYICYRRTVEFSANEPYLNITFPYYVLDKVLVLIDGKLVAPKPLESPDDFSGFGYWRLPTSSFVTTLNLHRSKQNVTIDLVVENLGRIDLGPLAEYSRQFKGIYPDIGRPYINGKRLTTGWTAIGLDSTTQPLWKTFLDRIGWSTFDKTVTGPGFYRTFVPLTNKLRSTRTFMDMRQWYVGNVFVDGNEIGRYMSIGPSLTLYVSNYAWTKGEIIIFEHFKPQPKVVFADQHILMTTN